MTYGGKTSNSRAVRYDTIKIITNIKIFSINHTTDRCKLFVRGGDAPNFDGNFCTALSSNDL